MGLVMSDFQAILLDLSGVLYEGSKVIPGAVDMVNQARERQLILRFVTNTATKSSLQILAQLDTMGIPVSIEELFTAPMAAQAYIREHQLNPYALVHPSIQQDFTSGDEKYNVVVLGDAREGLNYHNLNRAFRLCMEGAPLIAIGMNKYFKDDGGLMLDAGPFVHALEWAASTQAIIMGKPSVAFFEQVVNSTGLSADQCLMVGDDVISDVQGALDAGLQGCLVRTGKYQSGDEQQLTGSARVIDSIAQLLD